MSDPVYRRRWKEAAQYIVRGDIIEVEPGRWVEIRQVRLTKDGDVQLTPVGVAPNFSMQPRERVHLLRPDVTPDRG